MIWITSDWHLYHENIIKYTGRPFKNRHHMNKVILENYCNHVNDDDEVYFLGDLTLFSGPKVDLIKSTIEALPGNKHLILGNHDRFKPFVYHDIGFLSVHTALKTDFDGTTFYLAHDPSFAQIPDSIWLCGHVHSLFKHTKTGNNTIVINCCVEMWDYKPISLPEINRIISKYT